MPHNNNVEQQKQLLKNKRKPISPPHKKSPSAKAVMHELKKKGVPSRKKKLMMVSILCIIFMGIAIVLYYSYTNTSVEDNLDPFATGDTAGKSSGKVVDNDNIFLDPPDGDEDTFAPAHVDVNAPQHLDMTSPVALGDSTVAWSDNHKITHTPFTECDTEYNTWADKIHALNMGCAGKQSQEIADIARNNSSLIAHASTIFVTAGSNDIKHNDAKGVDKGIDNIVSTITEINPKAHIVFVGYLPIYINNECMKVKDRNSVRRLYSYHKKANYAMKDAALRHKFTYIDMFHTPYDACSDDTLISAPKSPGKYEHLWHTTPRGHDIIAQEIMKHVKQG